MNIDSIILIVAELIVIPTIPTPGSPSITSKGVGGRLVLVVTLKREGTLDARGLVATLARATINDASGVAGKGYERGLPIRTFPLANIDPGIAAGPIPKHKGSLPGNTEVPSFPGRAEETWS
tara:strand:+ start:82 stop:447 length:366 start_codon:yes stop_codon:yes gene_type:complete